MNEFVPLAPSATRLPALVAADGKRASMRFLEFFAPNVCNPHTRRAYYRAAEEFLSGVRGPARSRSPPCRRSTSDLDRSVHARAHGAERQAASAVRRDALSRQYYPDAVFTT